MSQRLAKLSFLLLGEKNDPLQHAREELAAMVFFFVVSPSQCTPFVRIL